MNKFKESAIKVLKDAKQPLHYREITKLAIESGYLETDGKTPEASMNAQLSMDIKNKADASDFVKTASSTFALNEYKKVADNENFREEDTIQEEKLQIEGSFTGKAGEHLVCSEMLFRGFNASIMSVDVGLDIVATKDDKMYGIQVKTSNLNSFKTYVFDLRKASFERHNSGNIFYIFVLHGEKENRFLILPYHIIEKLINQGVILNVGHGKRYRVNIKLRDGNIYLGTKENEMNYYLDNWELVK